MNIIGKYVKEERRKAGLTQKEFALRAGLGLPNVAVKPLALAIGI